MRSRAVTEPVRDVECTGNTRGFTGATVTLIAGCWEIAGLVVGALAVGRDRKRVLQWRGQFQTSTNQNTLPPTEQTS